MIQYVLDGDEDRSVKGLCHEWLGDGHTMLESPEAFVHYARALEYYRRADN